MTLSIGSHHTSGPPGDRTQPPPPAGFDAQQVLESYPIPHQLTRTYDSGLRRVPVADRWYFFRQAIITAALVVTGFYYGSWRFAMFVELGYVGKAFVIVEAFGAIALGVAAWTMAKRSRPQSAPPLVDLSLDVIIPVAGQTVDDVEQAINSVTRLRWAHHLVVCNDGPGAEGVNWRAIRSLCHDRGIRCLTRFAEAPDQAATLNHALGTVSGDIVLVVEPHRKVAADAADRMIGWFGDPSVAFVCGPDRVLPGSRDPLGRPDGPFTKTWEPSRDLCGLTFATGTAMYRRAHLDEVGGFVAGSNPALFTSKRLHTYGYHSVYEPDPVATAPGPSGSGEALQSLRSWAIDTLSTKGFPPGAGKVPRRVRVAYRLVSMYFPSLIIVLLATLAPAVRVFSRDQFFATRSEQELVFHLVPWGLAVTSAVLSWGGLVGGLRWFRSVLFAQSTMAIYGWASGQTGYGAVNDRGRQKLPESGHLVLAASIVPGVLLAAVVFGLVDSRPGGSALAIAVAAGLLVLGGGPLLHGDSRGFPILRWSMYFVCGATAAAALAAAYLSWQPPDGILASVVPASAAGEPNEPGDQVEAALNDQVAPPETATSDDATSASTVATTSQNATTPGDTASTTPGDTASTTPGDTALTMPPDIDSPAPGPVPHHGTLVGTDGIYIGLTAPDPPEGWDDVLAWPAQAVQPQILHWYQSWSQPPTEFRNDLVTTAQTANMTPLISWQAWVPPQGLTIATPDQPDFALKRIIGGDYDTYIDAWASAAAAYELPILLRPFQDPNGSWYPWSVGANKNTAKQYRKAWRRVVQRFRAAGADNVGFVWSISPIQATGGADQLDAYYPGDDFVDWVGVSGFVWDDYGSWAETADVPTVFAESYAALQARNKPIMFIDVGATQGADAPPTWVGDAMRYFSGLADLDAVVWFDRSWSDQVDYTLSAEQRTDLAAAVAEVDATVAAGGPAAEGLRRFLPQPVAAPGSTAGK